VSPKKRVLSRERKYFLLAKQKCLDGTAEDAYGSEAVTEMASDDEGKGDLPSDDPNC